LLALQKIAGQDYQNLHKTLKNGNKYLSIRKQKYFFHEKREVINLSDDVIPLIYYLK